MPIGHHPSFDRPPIAKPLWRYTDLPKFIELLTSRRLWLTNAEVLAMDDPYEGLPGSIRFPHRIWKTIGDVPDHLRKQIIDIHGKARTPEAAFRGWVMLEEQHGIYAQSWRRQYYVNCWHAASQESAAMWKIYGAPGAGVAVVSNGGRLETALASNEHQLNLGAVRYRDPNEIEVGTKNSFDLLMVKRSSYAYEQEVRLVYWDTAQPHDPIPDFAWNENTMRFDNIIEDTRPLALGTSLSCDINVLIERVIVSPFAPTWYVTMIENLRKQLGFTFAVETSKLLAPPLVLP